MAWLKPSGRDHPRPLAGLSADQADEAAMLAKLFRDGRELALHGILHGGKVFAGEITEIVGILGAAAQPLVEGLPEGGGFRQRIVLLA